MQKTIQKSLLILFALLQCMSPLAHAHVDGIDACQVVHSHALDAYEQISDRHVENGEGAVITVPHAYPASDSTVVLDVQVELVNGMQRVGDHGRVQNISAVHPDFHHTQPCYVLAWSQAPPRNILLA